MQSSVEIFVGFWWYRDQIPVDNAHSRCTLSPWFLCTLSQYRRGNVEGASGSGYRGGRRCPGSVRIGIAGKGWRREMLGMGYLGDTKEALDTMRIKKNRQFARIIQTAKQPADS